jgi:hypothetical protein
MGKAPEHLCRDEDDKLFQRDFGAEHSPRRAGSGWPMTCFASGVHADQAPELRKYFADRGCPTEVTNNGDVVYRDPAHRKRALKLRGFHDRASY